MQIFKRKKQQKEAAVSEPVPAPTPAPAEIGTNPTLSELLSFFNVDDITQIDNTRLTSATYYACMLIRCNAIARLPLKVKRKTADGGAEDLRGHSLYPLLHLRPNAFISIHDMIFIPMHFKIQTKQSLRHKCRITILIRIFACSYSFHHFKQNWK